MENILLLMKEYKCLAKLGYLEYDFQRVSCFEDVKKQSIKSILVGVLIGNKLNVFNFESAIAKSNYVCVKFKKKLYILNLPANYVRKWKY